MAPIIEVVNLTRRYGSLTAVDGISFTVESGSLFAFVGPNGAGKSTTVAVLTTLAPAHGGTVAYSIDKKRCLLGRDDQEIRSQIGIVFQDSLLDRTLTVRTNLEIRSRLYARRHKPVDEVVRVLCLDDIVTRKYGTLSGGQRRRVDIARALLAAPQILFLDEPTTGLDPQSRNLVWQTIAQLRQELGLTVFLTTHYLEEADQADQVTVIDHGKVIASGTPAELRATYCRYKVRLRGPTELDEALRRANTAHTRTHDVIEVPVGSPAEARRVINEYADVITDFEVIHGTMDDVFLALTGTSLRED